MFAILVKLDRICFTQRVIHMYAPNAVRAIQAVIRQNPDARVLGVMSHNEVAHV